MKAAVTSLKPGEISEIVETPVGYQFFKLLSGGEGGIVMQAPYDTVKEEIRDTLFRKAMEEEYKAWIEELKKNYYIKKML
jgi:peptidyl-prolyl cis-trans isomerase SurA